MTEPEVKEVLKNGLWYLGQIKLTDFPKVAKLREDPFSAVLVFLIFGAEVAVNTTSGLPSNLC